LRDKHCCGCMLGWLQDALLWWRSPSSLLNPDLPHANCNTAPALTVWNARQSKQHCAPMLRANDPWPWPRSLLHFTLPCCYCCCYCASCRTTLACTKQATYSQPAWSIALTCVAMQIKFDTKEKIGCWWQMCPDLGVAARAGLIISSAVALPFAVSRNRDRSRHISHTRTWTHCFCTESNCMHSHCCCDLLGNAANLPPRQAC